MKRFGAAVVLFGLLAGGSGCADQENYTGLKQQRPGASAKPAERPKDTQADPGRHDERQERR